MKTVQTARYLFVNMVRTARYSLAAWIKPEDEWWLDGGPVSQCPGDPPCSDPWCSPGDGCILNALDRVGHDGTYSWQTDAECMAIARHAGGVMTDEERAHLKRTAKQRYGVITHPTPLQSRLPIPHRSRW